MKDVSPQAGAAFSLTSVTAITKALCLLFCMACCGKLLSQQQNLNKNFLPLKSSSPLPPLFTEQTRDEIEKALQDLKSKNEKDGALRSSFLTASGYQVEKIVRSGNMLMNDEVTHYLNQLTDTILKDNIALRKQLNVCTLKSPVVNAYSFDRGYVFIDIGLIAQAETEAQLAFILCHEITHYTKQHHVNSYINTARLNHKRYVDYKDRIIDRCQYSKESESEADLEGFALYEKTRYNIKQAAASFDMLQYAHLPFELVRFKKSFLETPGYVIPQYYFLKEESPIRDNSHEDDELLTHPNIAKRKLAINNLAVGKDDAGKVNSVLGQERFEYIRDLARMELCRLYLKRRDYPNAFYAAYILAGKYPENEYVIEVLSKSLYAIALYNNDVIRYTSDSYLHDGIRYNDIEGFPQQLYYMIKTMPANEWTFLALNYSYRAHKKFPANKKMNEICDSLFNLTGKVKWGISDFTRTPSVVKDSATHVQENPVEEAAPSTKSALIASMQKQQQAQTDDTVYYKNMFVDLFTGDPEFAKRFPASAKETMNVFEKKSRRKNEGNPKIDKIVIIEPFYVKIDRTVAQTFQYFSSDKKQEEYMLLLDDYARQLHLDVTILDPGLIGTGDADKVNDYSVINDWLDERLDTEGRPQPIFNTDEIESLVAKYGTPYILRTGVASIINQGRRKRTYFFGFLVDIRTNKLIYHYYEGFKTKDYGDMLHAKTYQLLFDLKHNNGL